MNTQAVLPLRHPNAPTYTLAELVREARLCASLGAAIARCAQLAGLDLEKQAIPHGMDKARYSRIVGGREGILWPQIEAFCAHCGNDLPVVWMVHVRGWDALTLRRQETESEREIRELKNQLDQERSARVIAEQFAARVLRGGLDSVSANFGQ